MKLPEHLCALDDVRRGGGRVHVVGATDRIPYRWPGARALLLVADDMPEPEGSRGPDAFDSPHLVRWLVGADDSRGAVGVFAGDPHAGAYGALAAAALWLPGGAVAIECSAATWCDWSRFCLLPATKAFRFEVVPEELDAAALAHLAAEGRRPVRFS